MPRRSPRPVAQRRLGLRLALGVLALAGFLAVAAPDRPPGSSGAPLSVLLADGTLTHDNSRDGSAILTAANVWPGWSGDGEVTVTNSGTVGSWLRLTGASVDDAPGPAGGRLSSRLVLVIEDATIAGFAVPVYSGPFGAVGERWLGRMEPGEARTYRFRTEMTSADGDNAYQSSAVTARFDWAVSDTDPAAGPPPPPPPPPDEPPAEDPPVEDPPVEEPPFEDPPVEEPPFEEPPDDLQVVPDGPPAVEVKRRGLSVKLAIPSTQRPLRTGSLLTLASCSRRCRATVGGRMGMVRGGPSGHRIVGVSRVLSAGVKSRVRLRLDRRVLLAARRTLSRGRSVAGRVQIVARDRSGRVVRATQRIRLVASKTR